MSSLVLLMFDSSDPESQANEAGKDRRAGETLQPVSCATLNPHKARVR
jgi:hypothetical protein